MPEILLHHVILGGVLIGVAVGLLLLGNGRIAGIGGSLAQTIKRDPGVGWSISGYCVGPALTSLIVNPESVLIYLLPVGVGVLIHDRLLG